MTAPPDATALMAAFRSGRADPVAVAQAHLDRIAALDPEINAYSNRSETVLEDAARSAERWLRGAPCGPLDGTPVIVKDNLVSAGLPAAWGNAELARRIPTHDERPVAALRAAGAIVLGKGNTPEFAIEGHTANATFGVTRNPLDLRLTPGGSSGGVVAAVASGMAVLGLATDGGGSIRRPAGYTGLWGLKPGLGAVPRGGGLPQVLLDFESVGPIARSARDLALACVAIGAPVSARARSRLRILAVARIGDAPCDPVILERFGATVERMRGAGHEITLGELPYDIAPLNRVWPIIAQAGLARLARDEPKVLEVAAGKYQEIAAQGAALSAVDLYDALTHVHALREAARGLWGFDGILMPTAAAMPWPVSQDYPPRIAGAAVGPRGHAAYTGWVNAAGLPALAFPTPGARETPVGMQLIAGHGGESVLLAEAQALDLGALDCETAS